MKQGGVLPGPRNHTLAMMLDKGLLPRQIARLYGPPAKVAASSSLLSTASSPLRSRAATTSRTPTRRGKRRGRPKHVVSTDVPGAVAGDWRVKGWATSDRATALSFLSTTGLSMASVKARDRRSVTACARFQALWRGFRVRVAFHFMRYAGWAYV